MLGLGGKRTKTYEEAMKTLNIFAICATAFGLFACGSDSKNSTTAPDFGALSEEEINQEKTDYTDATTQTVYFCTDGQQVTDAELCPKIIDEVTGEEISGVKDSSTFVITKPATLSSSSSFAKSSSSSIVNAAKNDNEPLVTFDAKGATLENDNGCVNTEGSIVTIACGGTYKFTGENSDGQIVVNTPAGDSTVHLKMDGITLASASDAPIFVINAEKTIIKSLDGTTNTFSDASTRKAITYTKNGESTSVTDTTNACIYSKDDLTLNGKGTLIVKANYNNGVQSGNDLRVRDNPTITVNAANNALKGKSSVDIEGGVLSLTATNGDGIKSDECEANALDSCTGIVENKGIVKIKGGEINITKAGDDGIQAYNYIVIADSASVPTVNITSTGKGIVSENRVYVNGGNIKVTSGDDGIHSNLNIYFNGGNTTISAKGNDGVHADSLLEINDGTINVTESYEGFEAWYIRANGGVTAVYGTDDGWNAAGGNDGSGNSTQTGGSNWGGSNRPGMGGGFGGMGGGSSTGFLYITGGAHYVKTGSGDTDGIDSNGEMQITGGVVIVECQISGGMGGAFDSDGTATLTSKTVMGFSSRQKSEKGTNYSLSYSTSSYYGNSSIAFKPTTTGSYVVTTDGTPSVVSNVSSYAHSVTFPTGNTVYYN